MKKLLVLVMGIALCFGLCSCSTWSGNRAIYVKSDNATVFGGWGYVHAGKGTSILVWDNSTMTKDKNVGFLPVPQIQVDPNSNLNIGKPSKYPPSAVVAESQPESAIESVAKITTGGIPLPK